MSSAIDRFTQTFTCHGVADLYHAKTVQTKIAWALLILTATALAFYGCHGISDDYGDSPVYVNYIIRTAEKRYIPDVILCPFNRLDRDYVEMFNISAELYEHIQLAYGMKTPYEFQQVLAKDYLSNRKVIQELNQFLEDMNMTFSDLLDRSSTPCEVFIKYCYAPSSNEFYNCCTDAQSVMTTFGNCYRIPGRKQQSSGFGFGMTIVLDVSRDRYVTSISNLHNEGVTVQLAENSKPMRQAFTFLPNGVHALMALRATLYNFINMPPTHMCVEDDETYHQQKCFDECIFDEAETACNCSHATTTTTKFPACTPAQMYGCLLKSAFATAHKVYRETKLSIFRVCREKCKTPCVYWEYEPSISYSSLLTGDTSIRLSSIDLDDHIILDVFYERLEYTVIKHIDSKSIHQLISHVGGQLGLWVGASIVTLTQLVVFVVVLVKKRLASTGHIKSIRSNQDFQQTEKNEYAGTVNGTVKFSADRDAIL